MQTVNDPATLGMVALADVAWPISWRFDLRAPWGFTQQFLTVDCPELWDDVDSSVRLGRSLWRRALATASVRDLELLSYDTVTWGVGTPPQPTIVTDSHGLQLGVGTGRADSVQLVLHTGHMDRWARRRVPLPAVPSSWVRDGSLTSGGWGITRTLAQALMLGGMGAFVGSPFQLMHAYTGVVPAATDNPQGVAFRRVTHVRVVQFTDKAPDASSAF